MHTLRFHFIYVISDSQESPIPCFITPSISLLLSPALYLFHSSLTPHSPLPAECRFNCASLERSGLIVSIWESGQTKVPRVYHYFLGHGVFYHRLPLILPHSFFLSLISLHFLVAASRLSSPSSESLQSHLFQQLFHFSVSSIICACNSFTLYFLIISPLSSQTFKPSIWHLSLTSLSLSLCL